MELHFLQFGNIRRECTKEPPASFVLSQARTYAAAVSPVSLPCAASLPRDPPSHLQHSRNRPSAFFMMLALCTADTSLRLWSWAYLNANSATRVLALRVMTCTGDEHSCC